jgi:DNA-binding transcriptional LysR family regulator
VDLRQIRQFVTLADTLNFHRAAEALNMTQPPLSISIRRLEEELGAALFERHPRGVSLTEAAHLALPHARDALMETEALARAVRESVTGARGRLRVGFVGSTTYDLLPAIVPTFRERHSGIELSLREATSLEVVRGLEQDDLDIGLVRTPLLDIAAVTLEPLYREALMLLTPRSHWLTRALRVRLEDLKNEPFVVYDRVHVPNLFRLTVLACEEAGFLPRVVEEAAHIHTIIALVESGIGIGLAPAVMRRAAAGRTHCLELTVADRSLDIGLGLVTRRGKQTSAVRAFAVVARESVEAVRAIQLTYQK